MPGDGLLIRGGFVLSMDDAVGDVRGGDVLVEGPVGSYATRKKWEGRSKWGHAAPSPTSR